MCITSGCNLHINYNIVWLGSYPSPCSEVLLSFLRAISGCQGHSSSIVRKSWINSRFMVKASVENVRMNHNWSCPTFDRCIVMSGFEFARFGVGFCSNPWQSHFKPGWFLCQIQSEPLLGHVPMFPPGRFQANSHLTLVPSVSTVTLDRVGKSGNFDPKAYFFFDPLQQGLSFIALKIGKLPRIVKIPIQLFFSTSRQILTPIENLQPNLDKKCLRLYIKPRSLSSGWGNGISLSDIIFDLFFILNFSTLIANFIHTLSFFDKKNTKTSALDRVSNPLFLCVGTFTILADSIRT